MDDGITLLASGKIAAVVTFLEMKTPPGAAAPKPLEGVGLQRVQRADVNWYRALFRATGENWLWFSRLSMDDSSLAAILHDDRVDLFVVELDGREGGMLELDRRRFPEIEIAFLGLKPELIGRGIGKWLLREALAIAWTHGPQKVTVHTCTLDHPAALGMYRSAGFVPYGRGIEVADDPRLTGLVPRSAAAHIPLL